MDKYLINKIGMNQCIARCSLCFIWLKLKQRARLFSFYEFVCAFGDKEEPITCNQCASPPLSVFMKNEAVLSQLLKVRGCSRI